MRLFGVAIAILVGINLIHREVDRRTVYTILSKPLSRGEFLVGKFLGLTLTIWLQMAIMGARVRRPSRSRRARRSARRTSRSSCSPASSSRSWSAIATFFSAFTTPVLAAFFTTGVWVRRPSLAPAARSRRERGLRLVRVGDLAAAPRAARPRELQSVLRGGAPAAGDRVGLAAAAALRRGLSHARAVRGGRGLRAPRPALERAAADDVGVSWTLVARRARAACGSASRFVLGLVVGSFLNVVIHRLPRDESIVHPSSHCPSCQRAGALVRQPAAALVPVAARALPRLRRAHLAALSGGRAAHGRCCSPASRCASARRR